MKYFILLLTFLLPSISFASAVPTWLKGSGISYYFDQYNVASSTAPLLLFTPPQFSPANIGSISATSPHIFSKDTASLPPALSPQATVSTQLVALDVPDGGSVLDSEYILYLHFSTSDPSSFTNFYDWYATTYGGSISSAWLPLLIRSGDYLCYSGTCPNTVYVGYSQNPNDPATLLDYTPFFYVELNLQSGSFGNNPVYTVNAQPGDNIFPAYTGSGSTLAIAQSLKNAVAQNTVLPDCDFSEVFLANFWSECVARSIFNWLFIPSDAAIDQLVEVSTNPDFGRSWPYVVMAPIFTSTLVQACPLENPSTCDIGASPLTVPILDIYGSSTPFTIDVPTRVPAYIDAFFASILQAVIIVGISYALLNRFL